MAVTDPLTEVVRRRSDLQFTRKPSTAGLDCFGILGVALSVRVDGPCQDAGEGFGFQEGSEVVAQLNCQSASYTYCCDFRCVAHSLRPLNPPNSTLQILSAQRILATSLSSSVIAHERRWQSARLLANDRVV